MVMYYITALISSRLWFTPEIINIHRSAEASDRIYISVTIKLENETQDIMYCCY